MLIVYHLYKRIIYYFSSEWTNQRELWIINCRRFQSASFTLRRQKMLYSLHSDWCFIHYTVTDALLNIIMNIRLKLLFESDTITKKIYNQLMTINLTFDSKKVWFMIYKCKIRMNLHQRSDHLSIIMKLCLYTFFMQLIIHWLWKKMNMKALNIYLRIHFFTNHSLNDKTAINDRVAKITYMLQKVIKKSTFWAKSSNYVWDF